MHNIKDIFKNDEAYRILSESGRDRRQPKYRLFPPGSRLIRV